MEKSTQIILIFILHLREETWNLERLKPLDAEDEGTMSLQSYSKESPGDTA